MGMKIYTIGYTKKSAEEFFGKLEEHGIERVVDVRLKNTSQLAGFTKKADLEYFLGRVLGIEYCHLEFLAPTAELMKAFRDSGQDWDLYESEFSRLLEERDVVSRLDREFFSTKRSCLPSDDGCTKTGVRPLRPMSASDPRTLYDWWSWHTTGERRRIRVRWRRRSRRGLRRWSDSRIGSRSMNTNRRYCSGMAAGNRVHGP